MRPYFPASDEKYVWGSGLRAFFVPRLRLDLDYQAVVSRQWELACEMAEESGDHFVVMEVNITTKHKGEKRFRVYSEQSDVIVDGCYLLIFEPVA